MAEKSYTEVSANKMVKLSLTVRTGMPEPYIWIAGVRIHPEGDKH